MVLGKGGDVMKMKLSIIGNIVLLLCLAASVVYFNWDRIFSLELIEELPETFIILPPDEARSSWFRNKDGWMRGAQLNQPEDFIRDNIRMNAEKAVEIFKTLLVSNGTDLFQYRIVFPLLVSYDEFHDTYVVLAHLRHPLFPDPYRIVRTYRFEISRTGAVVSSISLR